MCKIGIVVIGYNNAESIQRLLREINNSEYEGDSPLLIISLDYSGNDTVYNAARNFIWKYGEKIVKLNPKRLGLKQHILHCGSYIEEYGLDALIVFEDDVLPSRDYYSFAKAAVNKYARNEQIAGISLYSWSTNRYGQYFSPLQDYSDVYFIQYPQSWGQVWLKNCWKSFEIWYENNKERDYDDIHLPDYLKIWGDNSWLKFHVRYCIEHNKYFVIPYLSRSTCFSEAGEHYKHITNKDQVEFAQRIPKNYNLVDFDETSAVFYDAFFENMSLYKVCGVEQSELTVDLYGTKRFVNTRYLLTTRRMNYLVVKSWGNHLIPHEMNIIKDIQGKDIFLYDRQNCTMELLPLKNNYSCEELRYQIVENWLWLIDNDKTLQLRTALPGFEKIAIYGYGVMGKHLHSMLKRASYNVICGIENKETYCADDIIIYNIDELKENVDCIIITVLDEFFSIEAELKKRYNIPIISIGDLIIEK